MNTYWISDDESNEDFWEHEWSTHGTCINTLKPSCYSDYTTGEEAADFFEIVVNLFQTLDTYTVRHHGNTFKILADDGRFYPMLGLSLQIPRLIPRPQFKPQ